VRPRMNLTGPARPPAPERSGRDATKAALVSALALVAGPVAAQDGWSFAFTPYAWLPALSTSVATDEGTVDIDTSGSDVLSNLDFAFMGAFEARKGRWGMIADLLYSDLSESKDTPLGVLFSRARVETKVGALSGYAAYRVFEDEKAFVDVMGGFRYFDTRVDLTLSPGQLPGAESDLKESWVDPIIGARARYDFSDHWFGTALIDYGGFDGSNDTTWQALGTVGYQFNDRWSVQGGYRYMDIEKEMAGADVKIGLSGPIIGFTVRF